MKPFSKAVAIATLVSGAAWAGDFIDTRVTFALANSNVFVKPGETTPSEPGTGFGASRANTQFYDNFNTRFTGFETLSNISLYKRSPSFFEGFDAEAALNVVVINNPSGAITLFDNASFVKLNYKPAGWGAKEDIALTGFPVSADRFRLGYAWKLSWGGDSAFTYNQGSGVSSTGRPAAVPGMKLQITRDRWYAFAGMKTGLILNNLLNVQERQYGVLFGGGVDLIPGRVRLEANGGYFSRGIVPSLAQSGVRAPVNALGGSMQLSIFSDTILPSLDMRLYKNDPDVTQRFFTPERYPGGFSYQFTVEGSALAQTLVNPDRFAATRVQPAAAIAVQARFKLDFWRFYAIGLYRTLSFIQFDVPGLPPYVDFATGSTVRPELWAAIGGDRHFPDQHLTVGLILGVQNPASVSSPRFDFGGSNPPPGLTGPRTVVVRDVNLFAILPADTAILPIFSIKGTGRLDISEYFAILGEVFYNRDDNRVTFRDSTQNIAQPVFEQPNQLGFNAVVQARF
ncbi:MAG: hypothetical protein DI536_03955 [Archangium gephyra]|uniref:Porin n=1 Tax=Archangium gephyra TaxID=48 RepID=A0A2W5TPH9_9BACT|nr:MAG: hypothetical protein DI536_03955 [Archangium gephyra]